MGNEISCNHRPWSCHKPSQKQNHAVDDLGLDIKVIYGVEAYFIQMMKYQKEKMAGKRLNHIMQ